MTITGSHVMIYSNNPEKDNKFFQEVLKFPYVSLGDGWLIFGLPPSEMMIGTAVKEKDSANDEKKKTKDKDEEEEKTQEAKESADGGALPSGGHQLLLMCDNIQQFVKDAKELGVDCIEPKDEGWGIVSNFQLPGGSKMSIYEPRHELPTYPTSIDITATTTKENVETATTNGGKHSLPVEELQENNNKKTKA